MVYNAYMLHGWRQGLSINIAQIITLSLLTCLLSIMHPSPDRRRSNPTRPTAVGAFRLFTISDAAPFSTNFGELRDIFMSDSALTSRVGATV